MHCSACGCDQMVGANFCRQCGVPLVAPPPQAAPPYPVYGPAMVAAEQRLRVRQHVQPMGILWIIFGVYRIAGGVLAATILHRLARGGMFGDAPPFIPEFLGSLAPYIAVLSGVLGLAAILAGIGLLTRQPWGRILAIVLAVLALLKIPFGTALGIYTLWVLGSRSSFVEWETISKEG